MHLVVNRAVFQSNFGHVATGFFHRFLDSSWHFFRLALAHAHAAIAVTHHSQSCETENTAALNHFGDAVDRDHFFAESVFWTVTLRFSLKFSHV